MQSLLKYESLFLKKIAHSKLRFKAAPCLPDVHQLGFPAADWEMEAGERMVCWEGGALCFGVQPQKQPFLPGRTDMCCLEIRCNSRRSVGLT